MRPLTPTTRKGMLFWLVAGHAITTTSQSTGSALYGPPQTNTLETRSRQIFENGLMIMASVVGVIAFFFSCLGSPAANLIHGNRIRSNDWTSTQSHMVGGTRILTMSLVRDSTLRIPWIMHWNMYELEAESWSLKIPIYTTLRFRSQIRKLGMPG